MVVVLGGEDGAHPEGAGDEGAGLELDHAEVGIDADVEGVFELQVLDLALDHGQAAFHQQLGAAEGLGLSNACLHQRKGRLVGGGVHGVSHG